MILGFLVESYLIARPDMDRLDVEQVVAAAVERAREKHSDFDRFLPAIEYLGQVFFTDHRLMPLDVFIETLYCSCKHGDYAKAWRADLKRKPAFGQQAAEPEVPADAVH
jgi:hypothetical protein